MVNLPKQDLMFPKLRRLTLTDEEMQRLYLRILKGSPRLQTLKLIGIECKEPVEIACIESIEVVESEVEFLLSEPVVTKKEDKIICLR